MERVPHFHHHTLIVQALSDGTQRNVVGLFKARGDGIRVRIHVTPTQAQMLPGPRGLSLWFQVCSQRPKHPSLLYFPKMSAGLRSQSLATPPQGLWPGCPPLAPGALLHTWPEGLRVWS